MSVILEPIRPVTHFIVTICSKFYLDGFKTVEEVKYNKLSPTDQSFDDKCPPFPPSLISLVGAIIKSKTSEI